MKRLAIAAAFALACREGRDPGFEIVPVPQSAYAAVDGGKPDVAVATVEAGANPVVLCITRPEGETNDDDESSDDCPKEYQGRQYDEKATARHRSKGDDPNACCYRRGRASEGKRIILDEE